MSDNEKRRTMTVLEIVKSYLVANDLDGLFSVDGECACEVAHLAPCDALGDNCEAGTRVNGCLDDCGNGCDFHIVRK